MVLSLNDDEAAAVFPVDVAGFATACSLARAARLLFEQKPARNRTAECPAQSGRPVPYYRVILAADIARLMRAQGIEPKLIRGDQYEEAGGAFFHQLFQLAQRISGDCVVVDTSRILRVGLEVRIEEGSNS